MQSEQEIPLTGAQKGLVLCITSEGGIVHWLGARPNTSSSDPSLLVGMVELLPYQDGSTLPPDNDLGSTEILDSVTTVESGHTQHQEILEKSLWPVTHFRSLCHMLQIFKTERRLCLTSPRIP
jgi:hypothetical protein